MFNFLISLQFPQELEIDLSSQKAKLESIKERVKRRYSEIPADISRRLEEVHLSMQKEEEVVTDCFLLLIVGCIYLVFSWFNSYIFSHIFLLPLILM